MSEVKKLRRLRPVKKKQQPEEVAYPELENALMRMKQIQDDALEGRLIFLNLEAWVLDFMKKYGIETYDRGKYRATTVSPMGEVVDWDGLKKKLKPEHWKQILGEPQPVKDKLAALMELGIVPADVVKEFITDKPIKPHVKITTRS